MPGLKSFALAVTVPAGIGLVNKIHKGQFTLGLRPF